MRTRTRKQQRELFLSNVSSLLLQLGGQQDEERFVLQTKVGRLTLFPIAFDSNELGTVFGRFDDPKAARQLVDCNPYSGKWNCHFFAGWDVEMALDDFAARLEKVLPAAVCEQIR